MPTVLTGPPFMDERSVWFRYGIALFAVAVALTLRVGTYPFFGSTVPYLFFYPAVALTALYAGFGPGLLATCLSAFLASFWMKDPSGRQIVPLAAQAFGMLAFILVNLLVVWTCERMRRATRRAIRAEASRESASIMAGQAEALRTSEERLRATFDNAGVGIAEMSEEDRIVAVNDRACEILGYRREELLNTRIHDLTAPEDREVSTHLNAELHAGIRSRIDYEKRYIKRDDSRLWVRVTVSSVRNAAGLWTSSIATIEDISERKQAEEALRQNEAFLRMICETTPDPIFAKDRESRLRMANPATLRVYGKSLEEVLGKSDDMLYSDAETGRALIENDRIVIASGIPQVFEETIATSYGKRVFLSTKAPYRDADGRIIGIVGVARDITERKQTEESLKQSEAQLRQIIDLVPAFIFIKDWDGNLLLVNKSQADAYNTTVAELTGKPQAAFQKDASELRHMQQDDREVMSKGRTKFIPEETFIDAQGNCRLLQTKKVPFYGFGEDTPAVLGVAIDITEAKRTEESLRASEARFRGMFNEAPLGIAVVDSLNGRFYEVNPTFAKIAGRTVEEMERIDWLSITHPDDIQEDLDKMALMNAGRITGFQMAKRYLRPDGTYVWINMTIAPMYVEDKSHPRHLLMIEEITERKRMENALKQAKEAAEAANQAKDQFISVLSHELRTPLMPVMATVTAMETYRDLPQQMCEDIETIHRNVEMEAKLIDDLLDVTRISQGKLRLKLEAVDAHSSLQSALQICQTDIKAKHLEVMQNLDASLHHVWADPTRLRQVFWNLLKNAVKFTPEHGRIFLRSSNAGDRVRIEITDTGIGIEPEVLPRIFNAFEQGEQSRSRQFGGLGLGLSIAKAVLETQGGLLTAFSKGSNQGATFTVDMVTIAPVQEPPTPEPLPDLQEEHPQRILLVDDHADTLQTMTRLLRRWGHLVTTATNVHDALEIAAKETFDLLISDLGLPDGSGLDIMKQVKDRYGLHGIALSGYGTDEDLRRSREAGFDEHLIKPVSFQTLRETIQRIPSKPE